MHLVGFTIEIYYNARSCERQIKRNYVCYVQRIGVGVHTRHNGEGDGKATRAYGALDEQLNTFSALELERARGEPCLLCCLGVNLVAYIEGGTQAEGV